jgi:hypothetical protein
MNGLEATLTAAPAPPLATPVTSTATPAPPNPAPVASVAHSTAPARCGADLVDQLGDVDPAVVVFFGSPAVDGDEIADDLVAAYPDAQVLGCTTAGEFTHASCSTGGAVAMALPRALVRRSVVALADLRAGVTEGVAAAAAEVERQLGAGLDEVDPDRTIGLVLIDGVHGSEDAVNHALGNRAPALSFVGGSAGDDQRFERTRVWVGSRASDHGAALLVVEPSVPFAVVKTCSFDPTPWRLTATRVRAGGRIVEEFDGERAADAYARAVGRTPGALAEAFLVHPLGVMMGGEAWLRSPYRVLDDGSVEFFAELLEGVELTIMQGTDLVHGTAAALSSAFARVGGQPSAALMFNCILRRLEMDAEGSTDGFLAAFRGVPTVGFHTYGESWFGHINQTLTGVVFG